MAASDYTQLPEPDVRHMRPERGVQDDSTAQAITGFGELALEAGAMYREKKDKEALAELEGELEAEREDVLSEQDQAVVDKEGKNVDRLARAVKAAPTKEYEFRNRAETRLKQAMDKHPHLRRELQARAGGVLGFNPIGSEIDAHFNQQKAAAKAQSGIDAKRMEQGAKWGLPRSAYGTPEYEEYYNKLQAKQRKIAEIDMDQKLRADKVEALSSTQYATTKGVVDAKVEEMFGKPFVELTATDKLSMDEGERTQAINRLNNMKTELQSSYVTRFGSGEQTNAAIKPTLTYIDNMINFLDPNTDATQASNKVNAQEALILGELQKDPDFVEASILFKYTGQAQTGVNKLNFTANTLKLIGGVMKGSNTDLSGASEGGVATSWINRLPNESSVEANERFKNTLSVSKDWMKNAEYEDASANERLLMQKFVNNYTAVLGQEGIKPNQQQAILETFTDPSVIDFIISLPEGEALYNVVDNTRTYARTSALAAARYAQETKENFDILGVRGPARKAGFTDQILGGSTVDVSVSNGVVTVTNNDPRTNVLSAKLRTNYVKRINTAIQAMSAITGKSMEDAAQAVFSRDPEAFSWIEGAQQPEQIGGAGQGPLLSMANQQPTSLDISLPPTPREFGDAYGKIVGEDEASRRNYYRDFPAIDKLVQEGMSLDDAIKEATKLPTIEPEGTLLQDEEGNKFRVVGGKYVREQ